MPPKHLTVPVDALQVERVGADAPDHRAVVAWVLAIGRAAVKGHAADAAHIVACSGAGGERVRGGGGASTGNPSDRSQLLIW